MRGRLRRLGRWAEGLDAELLALILTLDAGGALWLLWLVGDWRGWW